MRIEPADRRRGAVDLRLADLRRGVDHLALQVRQRDHVVVDHAERADARPRRVEQHRRAEPAGADHQHARAAERGLSRPADLAQHDVAGIAFKFVGIQHDVSISLNGTRGHRKVSPVFGCAAFSSLQLAWCAVRLRSAVDGGCYNADEGGDHHWRSDRGGRGVGARRSPRSRHVRKATATRGKAQGAVQPDRAETTGSRKIARRQPARHDRAAAPTGLTKPPDMDRAPAGAARRPRKGTRTETAAVYAIWTAHSPAAVNFPAEAVGWRLIDDAGSGARLGVPEKLVPPRRRFPHRQPLDLGAADRFRSRPFA